MPPTLDPKNDVVFKLLFSDERNRDLLRSLLNAVLQPPRPIVSVEVINPEIRKDAVDDRGLVLDILAVDDRGTRTDVEMQAYAQEAMPERALYHWARLYRDGLGRGDAFAARLPCRVIFILTHPELLGVRVHSIFRVLEAHDGDLLSDALEIHTIELTKLREASGGDPGDGALLDWARFLAADTEEERRDVATHNPDIDQAREALDRLSQDPQARLLARWREDQLRLYRVELAAREERGRREGHEEGRHEGQQEGRQEGRQEGIRTAIEALCEVLAIELSPERRAALAAMDEAALDALLAHLRQHRAWPL